MLKGETLRTFAEALTSGAPEHFPLPRAAALAEYHRHCEGQLGESHHGYRRHRSNDRGPLGGFQLRLRFAAWLRSKVTHVYGKVLFFWEVRRSDFKRPLRGSPSEMQLMQM